MAAAPVPAGQTAFNEHPQPRTFAPSKEDVLQNLQYFFGAPVSPEKLKDYVRCHAPFPRIDACCCSRAASLCVRSRSITR